MDSTYRPQSPDLSSLAPQQDFSSYAPRSPDLSGLQPHQPDPSPRYGHHHSLSRDRFGNIYPQNQFSYQGSPTSVPTQPSYDTYHHSYDMPATTRRMKAEAADDEYLPDAYGVKQEPPACPPMNDPPDFDFNEPYMQPVAPQLKQEMDVKPPRDPTLGVQLKTSFPVARIKRIMQADDDIGKVAQVTPHVVSRALELFMIHVISASAAEAAQSAGGSGKGPKRVLAQHVKRALQSDTDHFDFLDPVCAKVPDAPVKAKKEAASDSDDEGASAKPSKRRVKKRKDSGDD